MLITIWIDFQVTNSKFSAYSIAAVLGLFPRRLTRFLLRRFIVKYSWGRPWSPAAGKSLLYCTIQIVYVLKVVKYLAVSGMRHRILLGIGLLKKRGEGLGIANGCCCTVNVPMNDVLPQVNGHLCWDLVIQSEQQIF